MKKEQIEELAEVFGANGNMQIVFGEDLKDTIDELIADGLDADEVIERIDCKQIEAKNDEIKVDVKDDDVFLAVYDDSYDSYYNVDSYIDPVHIMNAIDVDSQNNDRYKKVAETIEKIKELVVNNED